MKLSERVYGVGLIMSSVLICISQSILFAYMISYADWNTVENPVTNKLWMPFNAFFLIYGIASILLIFGIYIAMKQKVDIIGIVAIDLMYFILVYSVLWSVNQFNLLKATYPITETSVPMWPFVVLTLIALGGLLGSMSFLKNKN